jgi:hypothetical protein
MSVISTNIEPLHHVFTPWPVIVKVVQTTSMFGVTSNQTFVPNKPKKNAKSVFSN